MQINGVILCAGKGTRMKSELPKVVHKVCEYEMVNLVLKSLTEKQEIKNTLVLGYKKEEVLKRIDNSFEFDYAIQDEQLGTGHAVKCAINNIDEKNDITIVTYGDTPLVKAETYERLVKYHIKSHHDLTVLTSKIDDATGYGRIIRDDLGRVSKIVEEKDADKYEKQITEFNTGIYCFNTSKLIKHLYDISNENNQQEYYLTDLVSIFNENNYSVGAYITKDSDEVSGVNDLIALSKASKILQRRINEALMINGVNIIDPEATYIGPNVEIGEGCTIDPNNYIHGNTKIGKNNHIRASNYLNDVEIGNGCVIGPMSHLRDGVVIGNDCRIGNFVEIKKSTIGNNTKAAHLTYIGDAEIGNDVNFGCGVITANYDGVNKNKTVIGDNVFVGSNVNLIAPIEIENNSFIAAATTLNQNLGESKFAIDRTKVRIKDRRK